MPRRRSFGSKCELFFAKCLNRAIDSANRGSGTLDKERKNGYNQPTSQPASQPANQPPTHPTNQPTNQPAINPSNYQSTGLCRHVSQRRKNHSLWTYQSSKETLKLIGEWSAPYLPSSFEVARDGQSASSDVVHGVLWGRCAR